MLAATLSCAEPELSMAIDGDGDGDGEAGRVCYLAVLEAEELHGLLGAVDGDDCTGNCRTSLLESCRTAVTASTTMNER